MSTRIVVFGSQAFYPRGGPTPDETPVRPARPEMVVPAFPAGRCAVRRCLAGPAMDPRQGYES